MMPTHWLQQLNVHALSLVDKGANKRRFQIFKSHTAADESVATVPASDTQHERPLDPPPPAEPSGTAPGVQTDAEGESDGTTQPVRQELASKPTVHAQQQLEEAVQAFQEALQQAHHSCDASQQQQLLAQARQHLLRQVQQRLGPDSAQAPQLQEDTTTRKPSPVEGTVAGQPDAAESSQRQQEIAAVSKALQTTLHHSLQRQHQRLSRMAQQLLQLETRVRQLSKSAGASNAESAQADHEAHTAAQQTPGVWEEITDGFGYVRKEVLRQRHRPAPSTHSD